MGIKKDALEILSALYNLHIAGKKLDLAQVLKSLDMTNVKAKNGYNYLEEAGLVEARARTVAPSETGLPKVLGLRITKEGIDTIEDEDKLHEQFGNIKIELNQNGQVNVLNMNDGPTATNISTPVVKNPKYQNVGKINYF